MRKHAVFCVDDEPTGLRVRKLMLEHSGYDVLIAETGQQDLELFREQAVHAVVLDYYMPGMNGAEVAAIMKQLHPEIPIVLLSAYVDLPPGACDSVDVFITKGQSPRLLLDTLQQLLPT